MEPAVRERLLEEMLRELGEKGREGMSLADGPLRAVSPPRNSPPSSPISTPVSTAPTSG